MRESVIKRPILAPNTYPLTPNPYPLTPNT